MRRSIASSPTGCGRRWRPRSSGAPGGARRRRTARTGGGHRSPPHGVEGRARRPRQPHVRGREQEIDKLEQQADLLQQARLKFTEADVAGDDVGRRSTLSLEAEALVTKAGAIEVDRTVLRVVIPDVPDTTPGIDDAPGPLPDGAVDWSEYIETGAVTTDVLGGDAVASIGQASPEGDDQADSDAVVQTDDSSDAVAAAFDEQPAQDPLDRCLGTAAHVRAARRVRGRDELRRHGVVRAGIDAGRVLCDRCGDDERVRHVVRRLSAATMVGPWPTFSPCSPSGWRRRSPQSPARMVSIPSFGRRSTPMPRRTAPCRSPSGSGAALAMSPPRSSLPPISTALPRRRSPDPDSST